MRHVKHHCSVHMQSNVIKSSHVLLLVQSYLLLSHEFEIVINHEVGDIEIIFGISREIIGGGNDNHHRWSLKFGGLFHYSLPRKLPEYFLDPSYHSNPIL